MIVIFNNSDRLIGIIVPLPTNVQKQQNPIPAAKYVQVAQSGNYIPNSPHYINASVPKMVPQQVHSFNISSISSNNIVNNSVFSPSTSSKKPKIEPTEVAVAVEDPIPTPFSIIQQQRLHQQQQQQQQQKQKQYRNVENNGKNPYMHF